MQTKHTGSENRSAKKEKVLMNQQNHYYISRKYSYIPGLQEETEDTYEISTLQDNVIIRYTCSHDSRILSEQKISVLVPFSKAKNIITFLSENSCRGNNWIDIIRDNDISYSVIE